MTTKAEKGIVGQNTRKRPTWVVLSQTLTAHASEWCVCDLLAVVTDDAINPLSVTEILVPWSSFFSQFFALEIRDAKLYHCVKSWLHGATLLFWTARHKLPVKLSVWYFAASRNSFDFNLALTSRLLHFNSFWFASTTDKNAICQYKLVAKSRAVDLRTVDPESSWA